MVIAKARTAGEEHDQGTARDGSAAMAAETTHRPRESSTLTARRGAGSGSGVGAETITTVATMEGTTARISEEVGVWKTNR
jgi:hypothetical protein